MADAFGALQVPVQDADPRGDPGLAPIGDYLLTVLNANAQAVWAANRLGKKPNDPVVKSVKTVNPDGFVFDDCELPALFVFRVSGSFEQETEDDFVDHARIHLVWMLPHDRCRGPRGANDAAENGDDRHRFFNAIAKIIGKAIHAGKDRLWSFAGDPDPLAANVAADADSVKLAVSTSVTEQVYSGASLDGVRGGADFAPRLQPTVSTTAVPESAFDDPGFPDLGDEELGVAEVYNTTAPIVWTCIDWGGRTVERVAYLTLPLGGETVGPPEDVVRVVSVRVPAQLSTLGTLQFGTGPFTGLGSDLADACGMRQMRVGGWRPRPLKVDELDASGRTARRSTFEAVEVVLTATEVDAIDLTDTTRFHPSATPGGVDIDVMKDGLLVTRAEL